MNKKKTVILLSASLLAMGVVGTLIAAEVHPELKELVAGAHLSKSDPEDNTLSISSFKNNLPKQDGKYTVNTTLGNPITFTVDGLKSSTANEFTLNSGGSFYNDYDQSVTNNNYVSGIKSITVKFAGKLDFSIGYLNNENKLVYGALQPLTSTEPLPVLQSVNHFKLSVPDGQTATISRIAIKYTCVESYSYTTSETNVDYYQAVKDEFSADLVRINLVTQGKKYILPTEYENVPITHIKNDCLIDRESDLTSNEPTKLFIPKSYTFIAPNAFSALEGASKEDFEFYVESSEGSYGTGWNKDLNVHYNANIKDFARKKLYGSTGIEYTFDESINGLVVTGYTGSNKFVEIPEEEILFGNLVRIKNIDHDAFTGVDTKGMFLYAPHINMEIKLDKHSRLTIVSESNYVYTTYPRVVLNYSGCHGVTKDGLVYVSRMAKKDHEAITIVDYIGLNKDVNVPDNIATSNGTLPVEEINELAFTRLDINQVNLGHTVRTIRTSAFESCKLTKITFSDQLAEIGKRAFADADVEDVVIPNNVQNIGDEAFFMASGLRSIRLNDGLVTIGAKCFYDSTMLRTIYIPSTVVSFGAENFFNMDNLKIYCAQAERPTSWDANWLSQPDQKAPVTWNSPRV